MWSCSGGCPKRGWRTRSKLWQWQWLCFCTQLSSALHTQKINPCSGLAGTEPQLALQGKHGWWIRVGLTFWLQSVPWQRWVPLHHPPAQLGMAFPAFPGSQAPLEPLPWGFSELCFGTSQELLLSPAPAGIPVRNSHQCQPAWGCAAPFPWGFSCPCHADISIFQFTKHHQVWKSKLVLHCTCTRNDPRGFSSLESWCVLKWFKGKFLPLGCTGWWADEISPEPYQLAVANLCLLVQKIR